MSPIYPISMKVQNFRGIKECQQIELGQEITHIIGENGQGKSSWLNALEWALFGSMIAKKQASGIGERGDWSLYHKGASGDMLVSVDWKTPEGVATLTRSRSSSMGARESDQVKLTLADGTELGPEEVADWMNHNRLPDWSAWKVSFCQHQELARERILEATDRSSAIAGMLGLEPYRKIGEEIRSLNIAQVEKRCSAQFEKLESELGRLSRQPEKEREEIERHLETLGLSRAMMSDATLEKMLSNLNHQLMENFGESLGSAGNLSRQWSDWVRSKRPEMESLRKRSMEKKFQAEKVKNAESALQPAKIGAEDARTRLENLKASYGTKEKLASLKADEQLELEKALDEQKKRDALGRLLQDAHDFLAKSASGNHCPVCDSEVGPLKERLAEKISSAETSRGNDEVVSLRLRLEKLDQQIRELQQAEIDFESKSSHLKGLQRKFEMEVSETKNDPNDLVRQLTSESNQLLAQVQKFEDLISTLSPEVEKIEWLEKHRSAQNRSEFSGSDISETMEWTDLQEKVDQVAAMVRDLGALSEMARELENRRSEEKLALINEHVDGFFQKITSGNTGKTVSIRSKKTASKVSYQLVDGSGDIVTEALNQAGFNALSLSILLASAQSRVSSGLPQFLLLDDPAQSFDQNHLAGLSETLRKVSQTIPVLVATFPGFLTDQLITNTSEKEKRYRFSANSEGTGSLLVRDSV